MSDFKVTLTLASGQYVGGQRQVQDATRGTTRALGDQDTALRALTRTIRQLYTAYFALRSLSSVVTTLVSVQVATDKMSNTLFAASGSVAKASQEMQWLRQQSAALGIDFRTFSQEYAKFAASAGRVLNEAQVHRVAQAVMTATTAMGGGAAEAQHMMLALQQMLSIGRVRSQELNLQLGQVLPGALEKASRAMNMEMGQFMTAMENGQIRAEDFVVRLSDLLINDLGAAAEKGAHSMQAGINRMSVAWFGFVGAMNSGGATEAITQVLASITEWLDANHDLASQIGGELGSAIKALGAGLIWLAEHFDEIKALVATLAFAELAGGILRTAVAAEKLVVSMGAAAAATRAAAVASGEMTASAATLAGPFGAIVVALGALTYWLGTKAIKAIDDGSSAMTAYDDVLRVHKGLLDEVKGSTLDLAQAQVTRAAADQVAIQGTIAQTEADLAQAEANLKLLKRPAFLGGGSPEQIADAAGAVQDYENRLKGLQRMSQQAGKALSDFAANLQSVAAAQKKVKAGLDEDTLKKYMSRFASLQDSVDKVAAVERDLAQARKEGAALLAAHMITQEAYDRTLSGLRDKLNDAIVGTEDFTLATERNNRQLAIHNIGIMQWTKNLEELRNAQILAGHSLGLGISPVDGSEALPQPRQNFGAVQGVTGVKGLPWWLDPSQDAEVARRLAAQAKAAKDAVLAGINAAYNAGDVQDKVGAEDAKKHWFDAAQSIGSALATMFEKSNPGLARLINGAQQFAQAFQAAQAIKEGDYGGAAMAGAGMGAGLYGTGIFGDAGRGQGQFGGQLSGNYADVGATVGAAIGTAIGAMAGGVSAPVGGMIGAVIGGVVGSAIKSGADEGLAQLRQIGNDIAIHVTKDEGGLGGMIAGVGQNIADGLKRVISAIGGTLNSLSGGLDLKVRDDEIIVFVNGLRRVFRDAAEAVNFAIGELIRTADISGLSANMQAVLAHSRSQQGGSVSAEALTSDLQFAQQMDRLDFGRVGQSLAELSDWFRVTADRAVELGLTQETLAAIVGKLNAGFEAARQTLEMELDTLAGVYSAAGQVVAQYSQRVDEALQGAREYNQAVLQESQQRAARIAAIQREMVAQQAAAAAARAAAEQARMAMEDRPGTRAPGDTGSTTPEEQRFYELEAAAHQAEQALASLAAELGLLTTQADQTAIDMTGRITAIIGNSVHLFDSFTDQFLGGPVQAFHKQMEQFADYKVAAADLYKSNMELATTDEQRALAARVLAQQLAQLSAAQDAYLRSVVSGTALEIFDGLANLLQDGPDKEEAMRQAAEMRYDIAKAELRIKFEELKLANDAYKATHDGVGLISSATIDWIDGVLGRLPEDVGKKPGGGGKGGGGRQEQRKDLIDRLNEAIRGPLSGYADKLEEINRLHKQEEEEARKLGLSLDLVNKANEARIKRLKEEIALDVKNRISPMGDVAKQIADLDKWAADLRALPANIRPSLDEIAKAVRAGMRRIVTAVQSDVRNFANIGGRDDLGVAILGVRQQANALRESLAALAAKGVDVSDELKAVNDAEEQRIRLLRTEAKIDIFERIAGYLQDGEDKTWLLHEASRLKYQMELAMLRAQFEILKAMPNFFTPEQLARLERAFAAIPLLPPSGDTGPAPLDPNHHQTYVGLFQEVQDVGDATGGLAGKFRQLTSNTAELRKRIDEANISDVERRRLLQELAKQENIANYALERQATADLMTNIAGYLDDGVEKTALLQAAAEIKYQMERAELIAQFALLKERKALTDSEIALIQGAIDSLPDHAPPPAPPGGIGSGNYNPPGISGWHGTLQEWLDQIADRIAKFNATIQGYLHPEQSGIVGELERLRRVFVDLRAEAVALGQDLGQVAEAEAMAVQALIDSYLDPIRQLQHDMQFGQGTPLDVESQFNLAMQEFLAAQAAFQNGDLSVLETAPDIVNQLLALAQQMFPVGSQAYLGLFNQLMGFLTLLQTAGQPGAPGGPGGPGGPPQPVSLTGSVHVTGMAELREEQSAANWAIVGELTQIRIATQQSAGHNAATANAVVQLQPRVAGGVR